MSIITSNLSRQIAYAWPVGGAGPQDMNDLNETMPLLINAINNAQSNNVQAITERHAVGTFAQLPPAGVNGRLFFATDQSTMYLDLNGSWLGLTPAQVGTIANRPPPGVNGRFYYATDQPALYIDINGSWLALGFTMVGVIAGRPAPGVNGRIYYATDQPAIYVDVNGSWLPLGINLVGLAANRPAPGVNGREYFATDTGVLSIDTNGAWITLLTLTTSSTWTPIWTTTGTTGAINYTAQVGNRIQIGNQVQCTFLMSWTGFTGWSGNMFVSNFPTATLNLAGAVFAVTLGEIAGINSNLPQTAFIPANSTSATVFITNVGTPRNLLASDMTTTGTYAGSVIYPIA